MGRISPGPTRWPPGAERRLVPAKSNLKPQTSNCCSNNDATINRRHASRLTPNQPGMQRFEWERRPTGRRHHGAPRPPTTIPTDTPEYRNSTIIQPRNLSNELLQTPAPPEGASSTASGGVSARHAMGVPWDVLLQVASRLLKNIPGGGACTTGPLAWHRAPWPQNPKVDDDVR